MNPDEPKERKLHPKNLGLNIIIVALGGIVVFFSYSFINNTFFHKAVDPQDGKETSLAHGKVIQLDILNGCGVQGTAQRFTDYLRKRGFDVVQATNNRSFDVEYTHVLDRAGDRDIAKKVAEALGVDTSKILVDVNHEYFLNVSVVIGKDYQHLKPYQ
jgi:hypothetical protein